MSTNRVLSTALTTAIALIMSMLIFGASCSDVFAKTSPPAKVTVDFGAKHAALAQTVANAINENSGREGSDYYPYNEYGRLHCTVSGSVISLDFPTVAGDAIVKEGQVYAFFLEVTYKAIEKTDYKDQGEHFLSVGKKTIDKYTSNWEVWDEFEYAINNLGEKLSLNVLWEKPVTKASFTVTNALCGTEVKIIEHPVTPDSYGYTEQTPEPEVTASKDSELDYPLDWFLPKLWMKTKDLEPADLYPESDKCFSGKLTPETEVYVAICSMPKFGYYVDWDSKMDITVNGEKAELLRPDEEEDGRVPVVAKVTITHKWDAGKVTKKATEKATGVKTYTCTACNASKTEVIPKLKPSASKVSGTPIAKMIAKGKTSLIISWNKIEGADGYEVFFARCNHSGKKISCKMAENIMGNQTFKWTKSGLKKGTPYKAYVKAYTMKNGKKTYIKKSPTMHAYTGNGNKKYTNAKSVSVKKANVSLKKDKTYKIKAKVNKIKKSKKLLSNGHVVKLRYLTSDAKVATVSKSGKITAKDPGKCIVYVIAHNGVSKQVKVTVK